MANLLSKIKKALEEGEQRNFKQSLEVMFSFKSKAVNLQGEHKLDLTLQLPQGRGKETNIGVFAEGELNLKAKENSDYVLNKEELNEYAKDKRKMRKFADSCSHFIAQPDLMPTIGKKWGPVLGPRGKMPQPVPPTADPAPIIEKLKDTVKIKTHKNPTVHVPIGTEDMDPEELKENLETVLKEVKKEIPQEKISSIHVKKTMGKPIEI